MLGQILVGGATSVANIAFHAVLMALLTDTVRRMRETDQRMQGLVRRPLVIMATGSLLMVGHFLEVLLWAFTYWLVQSLPPGADTVYFAFGNYTTLGYGDVLSNPGWKLLGPITALNGILLIGWSTATTFEILRKTA